MNNGLSLSAVPAGPSQSPSVTALPEGEPRALRPRNDKLGTLAPQNVCRKDCQTAWRSGSAATDTIGTHHFNGGLYELQMPSRDCHVGLRPPRNDKPLAFPVLSTACSDRQQCAGPGCPLPSLSKKSLRAFFAKLPPRIAKYNFVVLFCNSAAAAGY